MTEPAPAVLSLRQIGKRYANGVQALQGLGFDLRPREIISLLGPSGCGKSSALRVVAGLEAATQGSLQWADGTAPALGFVFQEPTLMPWASVADNVFLPLRLQGRSRAKSAAVIADALERVGLADVADAWPRELSGGMKMRVSIARALTTRPRVLLMDEPFAALDEMTRLKLNDDLLAIQAEQGFALIFVTHSVYESVYLADRVMVLAPNPGRLSATITIDEARPRGESFRTSSRYNAHCIAVSQALKDALQAPAPPAASDA